MTIYFLTLIFIWNQFLEPVLGGRGLKRCLLHTTKYVHDSKIYRKAKNWTIRNFCCKNKSLHLTCKRRMKLSNKSFISTVTLHLFAFIRLFHSRQYPNHAYDLVDEKDTSRKTYSEQSDWKLTIRIAADSFSPPNMQTLCKCGAYTLPCTDHKTKCENTKSVEN